MPDLPILNVPQTHFDRIVAVFPGSTNAEKIANYRRWSLNNLYEFTRNEEIKAINAQYEKLKQNRLDDLINNPLPDPPVVP